MLSASALLLIALPFFLPTLEESQAATGRSRENIRVSRLDEKMWSQIVAHREGKGLLVNVWATWCIPCVEEFPDLVRLDAEYRGKGLDVVVVSLDFDDEIDGKVRPFLRRMKAGMPAYINAFAPPENLITALHSDWSGGVPATFVFDKNGRFVTMAVGKQSYKTLRGLAERALAQ